MHAAAESRAPAPKLLVEKKTTLTDTEVDELAIATEDAIRDGIGFNWLTPPMRETLESYWRGVLMVPGAFAELGVPTVDVADALAGELWAMAGWLGLGEVSVGDRGDLGVPLAHALRQYARR
jgi:hypothetical protein